MLEVASRAPRRILLVEDDPSLSIPLSYSLEAAGYQVQVASKGEDALRLCSELKPDLVLLDIMLPDVSGLDVCRKIRLHTDHRQPAIIVVTAKVQEADRVAAFEVGADDFVAKPFSLSELMLRIHARLQLRPTGESTATEPPEPEEGRRERITLGPLIIDRASHRVFLLDREVSLSLQEMRLLTYLASEPGKMRTRRELLSAVWGYHPEANSRTLDTHIKRLRDKFGPMAGMIQTAHGVGYRLTVALQPTSRPGPSGSSQRRR